MLHDSIDDALRHEALRLLGAGCVSELRVQRGGAIVTGIVGHEKSSMSERRAASHRVYIRRPENGPAQADTRVGECSCGASGLCVHIVAVSMAAAESGAAPPVPQSRASLQPGTQRAADTLRLFYRLDTHGEPALSVWVGHATADRNGVDPLSVHPFTPAHPGALPRYVDAQDADLLRALLSERACGPWALNGPAGQACLERAIATGRAFWQSFHGMPLTGPPRTLTPQAQARQTLQPKLILASPGAGKLFWLYNGHAIEDGGPQIATDTVRALAGTALLEIPRDRAREIAWRAQLAEVLPQSASDRQGWLAFMLTAMPRLQGKGWLIETESGFPYRLAIADEWRGEVDTAAQPGWFSLRLNVTLAGEPVNILPAIAAFLKAPQGDASFCRIGEHWLMRLADGSYLATSLERVQRIADTLIDLLDSDLTEGSQALALPASQSIRVAQLAGELDGAPLRSRDPAVLALAEELRNFSGIAPLTAPAGFTATLRPYQQEGLGWLQFLRRYSLGGVLADDMGLGKTVQALAHLATEKAQGRLRKPSLIVAPVSVIGNWQQELRRFAPDLKPLVLHGARRHEAFASIGAADVIITSYPLLQIDSEVLLAQEFHLLILDEAQTIKNPRARVSQMARALNAEHRLCLTGTPMENHLGELWSLLDFLQPGVLGSERDFQRHYRTPIEKHGDAQRSRALTRRIAPLLLRRTKDAVARELPPKTEIVETLAMDERQRDFYDGIRLSLHGRIREVVQSQGLARSQIAILDALLKLRQACCDPRLIAAGNTSEEIPSVKLDWLSSALPQLVEEGRRILLFSQFTSMLRLIEDRVAALDIPYCLLTGKTRARAAEVERFQSGGAPLFLISLKAGGTGLNLTAADTVIHYDPWWNPAVEAQATDRAHRIGQDKPVFVYKLLAQGTVEEKIRELQARKQALMSALYTDKIASPGALSAADLEALFAS